MYAVQFVVLDRQCAVEALFLSGVQVEALQTQMKEQMRLSKERVDGLLDDRRIHMEEFDSRKTRDQDKIQMLTEK